MICPECHSRMQNGYIPTSGGIVWFRKEEREGMFPFAKALRGTSSWFRRAKLEAYHCKGCELVLFRYGRTVEDPQRFQHQ